MDLERWYKGLERWYSIACIQAGKAERLWGIINIDLNGGVVPLFIYMSLITIWGLNCN
jgi:hypothetical protein